MARKQLRAIDFFCGAGGFSEGFRQAGIKVIWAVDRWQPAVDTHGENHPSCKTVNDDVLRLANLPDEEFHAAIPDTEIIIGSPPCTAFSNSNRSGYGDKSKGLELLEAYLRIVARKKFKQGSILTYWILENVPKVEPFISSEYSASDLGLEGNFVLQVKTGGSGVYNAKYYGVPSNRKRYFCGEFPAPEKVAKSDDEVTKLGALLESLGMPNQGLRKIHNDPLYDISLKGKDITDHHYLHQLADFEIRKMTRLKQDKGFMGMMSIPENLERPARTIMATMSFSARESFVLGYKDGILRAPTIREVATMMSFPIDYRFFGESHFTKYKLVGNAVAPKMAYALAKAIRKREGLRVRSKYIPIKQRGELTFYNLNGKQFPLKKEKPKKPTARFKYHIPKFKYKSYRVELTNYHSDFEKERFRWDAEIHYSQGPKAKVYTPNLDQLIMDEALMVIADSFVSDIEPILVNSDEFQRYFCLTWKDREINKITGPFELLKMVKAFIVQKEDSIRKIPPTILSGSPKDFPLMICFGYYILARVASIIRGKNTIQNGQTIQN